LILASASPRRREILERLGIPFVAVVPEVEEIREGPPADAVVENARRKARAALRKAPTGALILAVDTDVVLAGRTLGKAGNEGEARERLEALSGTTHEVLSGLVLLEGASGEEKGGQEDTRERSGVARSLVTFRALEPEIVELYLASGEWRDRAGAYAIQGLGSILVERLEGDFSNVVGLPVRELLRLAPELLSQDE
jgi:septum formation protein